MTKRRASKDEGLPAEVVKLAAVGRMHHSYINLALDPLVNARSLVRDLGKEVIRLRTMLTRRSR